jgi:hypothetical protein
VFTVAGNGDEAAGEILSVQVARVPSRVEAELIVGMLRNNGLRAAVSADDAGGQQPPLQAQGVRVLVTPSGEAPARRLLAAAGDNSPSVLSQAKGCDVAL